MDMELKTEANAITKGIEPVCSVCIANFNGRNVLEACLNSVVRQDFIHPIEIIVHDDASTDGSADIISKKYPKIRLMRSANNVGFCISNNRMVAMAKGRYILLLNNDAELCENALATFYDFAESESECGIIGLPQYDMQTGRLIDIGSLLDPFLNPIPNKNSLRRNVAAVSGACMWFPKRLWNELGGFPEWFESIAEDTYLCCLTRLKGYPVIALSKSGFKHWIGKSLGGGRVVQNALQTTYRRRALSERNKSYVMLMCYPAPILQLILPLHLLFLLGEGFVLSMVKRDFRIWERIYKSCLQSLWQERNCIADHRQSIQKGKVITLRQFIQPFRCFPHKIRLLFEHGIPTIK